MGGSGGDSTGGLLGKGTKGSRFKFSSIFEWCFLGQASSLQRDLPSHSKKYNSRSRHQRLFWLKYNNKTIRSCVVKLIKALVLTTS